MSARESARTQERERERDRERDIERDRERDREREKERAGMISWAVDCSEGKDFALVVSRKMVYFDETFGIVVNISELLLPTHSSKNWYT